jgi:hypothetical protein
LNTLSLLLAVVVDLRLEEGAVLVDFVLALGLL